MKAAVALRGGTPRLAGPAKEAGRKTLTSAIGEWGAREGRVVGRKQRRRVPPDSQSLATAEVPNRVWGADFKGGFRTGDGARIDPLTISDAHSRDLQRCQVGEKTISFSGSCRMDY